MNPLLASRVSCTISYNDDISNAESQGYKNEYRTHIVVGYSSDSCGSRNFTGGRIDLFNGVLESIEDLFWGETVGAGRDYSYLSNKE